MVVVMGVMVRCGSGDVCVVWRVRCVELRGGGVFGLGGGGGAFVWDIVGLS